MDSQDGRRRIPIVEGWFTMDAGEPRLIGNQCQSCGDYFFPQVHACRNPRCMAGNLKEVLLAREGRLWSFTVGYYPPPAPFVPVGAFTPYGLAAVELSAEKLMVLGQVASGTDLGSLRIGMHMEMVLETLQQDTQGNDVIAWKWKPKNLGNSEGK